MRARLAALLLIAPEFLAPACGAVRTHFRQHQARFERAVRDDSTAPYFVLVTIVDDTTNASWTGCTLANSVKGAIHIERNIPYDEASVAHVERIMLTSKDHVFHFSKTKTLGNIPTETYGRSDLMRARAYLRVHGTAFLLSDDYEAIGQANQINHAALACAIIERGLSARQGDVAPIVSAEP
jgi:hypothetical protein